MTTGIGALVGGTVGYSLGDESTSTERRLTQAFAGVLSGGIGGVAPGAMYDLFLRAPLKVGVAKYKEGASLAGVAQANPSVWRNLGTAASATYDEYLDMLLSPHMPLSGSSKFRRTAQLLSVAPSVRVGAASAAVTGPLSWLAGVPSEEEDGRLETTIKHMVYAFIGGTSIAAMANASFVVHAGAGRKLEEQAKVAGFFAGKSKGMSDDAAAEIVNKTIFNYAHLTPFEKNVMRRIFPFYTWTSKNLRLMQPYLLMNEPKRYAAFQHVLLMGERNFSDPADMMFIPEHLRYAFAVQAGKGRILARFGLPQGDVVDMTRPWGVASRMHPAVQIISRFFGHELYYNTKLTDVVSGRDVRYLPPGFQRFVGLKEVPAMRWDEKKKAPVKVGSKWEVGHFRGENGEPVFSKTTGTYRMAMLKSFPMWRLVTEYNKMITDRYLLGTTGGAPAETIPISPLERALPVFTGIKFYDINWEMEERNFWRAYNDRMWEILEDEGLTGNVGYIKKTHRYTEEDIDILRMFKDDPNGTLDALAPERVRDETGEPTGTFIIGETP